MYTCWHCKGQHTLSEQAKICAGQAALPTQPTPPAPVLPQVAMSSPRQRAFIKDLQRQRDWSTASPEMKPYSWHTEPALINCTYASVSAAISYALGLPRMSQVQASESLIIPDLLKMVQDGYYAGQLDDSSELKFFRVSRPKSGQFVNSIKVQQGFGNGYGSKLRYNTTHVVWASGKMSVYDRRVEPELTVVMAGTTAAARLFSEKIGRCCRCFAELTHSKSRHYGIGPECETYWPHIIQEKDEMDMLEGKLPWSLRPVHEQV